MSGDTLVAGAVGTSSKGTAAGSAFVFTRSGTQWSLQARLTADDGAASDQFGVSVAVSGNTIVVGSWEDDDGGDSSGSAYVFVRSGTTWTQQKKLTATDAQAGDLFGVSVDISGETVAVGAKGEDTASSDGGAVYVFIRSGTAWSQQKKLTDIDAADLGTSVGLDVDTLIAGAPTGGFGSAYVFTRSGTTWTKRQKLTAGDNSFDAFGKSVDVSGNTAVVGGSKYNSVAGAAYVFTRSGTTWTQEQRLTASDATAGDEFGASVAIDKDTIAVGARFDGDKGAKSGSAYEFVRKGSNWNQVQKLNDSDGAAGDEFGTSVAVAGTSVVAGAYRDDTNSTNSGTAFVFDPTSNAAPVANNDSYSVKEGFTISVATPGVLNNDTDANGDTLTAIKLSEPAKGALTFNSNGSFTYVHNGSQTTSDSFTYKANDGTLDSNVATVNITVTGVNDLPVAKDDSYTVKEGDTLTVNGVLDNDADLDGDTLTATKVTDPANGTLTFNSNGSFTYKHDGGETTSDSFTYKANDGKGDSNVATVNITVTPVTRQRRRATPTRWLRAGPSPSPPRECWPTISTRRTICSRRCWSPIPTTGP